MRAVFLAAAVVALALPAGAGSQQKRLTPQLDGHWLVVRSEGAGGLNPNDTGWTLIIAGDKVSWKSKGSEQITGPFDFSADPDATPAVLRLSGEYGIYRFDADTLIIGLWFNAGDRATTFDLSKQTKPGRMLTLRRIKDAR